MQEVERRSALEECSSRPGSWRKTFLIAALWVSAALALSGITEGAGTAAVPEANTDIPSLEGADGTPAANPASEAPEAEDDAAEPANPFSPPVVGTIVLLLALSAFFSACEVAFFSLGPLRIRAMAASNAFLDHQVAKLMQQPGELLTSILMGNSIVNVLLSVVLANPVEDSFDRLMSGLPDPLPYIVSVLFCAGLLVFMGEILPKLLVVRNNEMFARGASLPLYAAGSLLQPLRHGVIHFIGYLFRVTRFSQVRPAPFMTDEEFVSLLSEGEATGAIEKDEREMIQGILKVNDVMVRDILIPRPDIIALNAEATVAEALGLICEHEYSRIPVYRENLDQIEGILYAKDLLKLLEKPGRTFSLKKMMRPALAVPDTLPIDQLMEEFRSRQLHIAIVVDEFGSFVGIITMEDITEEILGDFEDEYDKKIVYFKKMDDNSWEINGLAPVRDLNKELEHQFPEEHHRTVGGMVWHAFGKSPQAGESVQIDNFVFKVVQMRRKAIGKLLVSPAPNN